MTYHITIYNNIFDTDTSKTLDISTLEKFEKFLFNLSRVPNTKPKAQLLSSAVYEEGKTRANSNVVEWSQWCAVDVDDITIPGDKNLSEYLERIIGKHRYICYSTASSSPEQPKFRLVFPLTSTVPAEKISHFWFALNKELKELGDPQTKDASRMFYIPADYEGAFNFFFKNDVDTIMDPAVIMQKHEFIKKTGNSFLDSLPEGLREEIIQHRKDQMTNRSITWSGYRDCPFFPKKLANEYRAITGTGWYHKMYQIMVAIAGNAIKEEYPITANEIATLCKELDIETGNWYANRPFELEATSAIEYVYRNSI